MSASEPHELTVEECRTLFLEHVWEMVEYWDNEERAPVGRDKLTGLAFSLLAALDGAAAGLPAWIVAPCPCTEDRGYLKAQGENWYPETPDSDNNIAGCLHERLHGLDPKGKKS